MSAMRKELVEMAANDVVEYAKDSHGVTLDIVDVIQIINNNIGWVVDIVEGEDVNEIECD